MREVLRPGRVAVLVIGLALLAGCGGDGDPESSSTVSDPLAGYPKGPIREFIIPGGDNAVPEYGREATPRERRQASRVIQQWIRARAARDFVEECRFFSRGYIRALVAEDAEIVSEGRVKTCPQALAYFGPQASGDFKNTLAGPVDSLRVPSTDPAQPASNQGFALYHGKDGTDYVIPVEREEGEWLVAKAAPLSRGG